MTGAWGDDDDVGEVRLVDVEGVKVRETEDGILLDAVGWKKAVWFPKKHVEDGRDGTFAIPEWLLEERGLA